MMDDQYHVHDLVAAYVLGAVTPEEEREVVEHLAGCAECRQLADELREVEQLLPSLAGEMTPSPRLKSRIMAAVYAEPRGTGSDVDSHAAPRDDAPGVALEEPPAVTGTTPAAPAPVPLPFRPRRLNPLLAVAAALVLVVAGAVVYRLLQPGGSGPTRTFQVAAKAIPSISGTLAYYKDGQKVELKLKGLKQLPTNRVYEFWLVKLRNGKPVRADGIVAFRPTANGTYATTLSGQNVPAYQLAGFTIEHAPMATTPTFPLVAQAGLT